MLGWKLAFSVSGRPTVEMLKLNISNAWMVVMMVLHIAWGKPVMQKRILFWWSPSCRGLWWWWGWWQCKNDYGQDDEDDDEEDDDIFKIIEKIFFFFSQRPVWFQAIVDLLEQVFYYDPHCCCFNLYLIRFYCYCGFVVVLNLLQFFTPILDEVLEDIEGGRFSVQVNFIQ